MSEPVTLSPGGPHSPAYTRQVANAAAETIRVLNHATLNHAGEALANPSDVDAVIEALATMHARLPQLCNQLTERLREWLAEGRLEISHGQFQDDPSAAVREIDIWLTNAAGRAGAVHQALNMARQITATITAASSESGDTA